MRVELGAGVGARAGVRVIEGCARHLPCSKGEGEGHDAARLGGSTRVTVRGT